MIFVKGLTMLVIFEAATLLFTESHAKKGTKHTEVVKPMTHGLSAFTQRLTKAEPTESDPKF